MSEVEEKQFSAAINVLLHSSPASHRFAHASGDLSVTENMSVAIDASTDPARHDGRSRAAGEWVTLKALAPHQPGPERKQ